MNANNFLYDTSPGDFTAFGDQDFQNIPRPSVLLEPRKERYRNVYNSKWANLKFFLQDKTSLEASVDLLKTKTVEQFSSKCREVYTKKIEIQLMIEKNRKLIKQGVKSIDFQNGGTQIEVSDGVSGLPTDSIPTFLFMFRENNHLMLKLIDHIDSKKIDILIPFLCHFFYENFYTENMEQEEIIYLVYLLLEKEIDKLITPSEQTFLDDSFLAQFLKEMGSRYEIKNYIDIVLNDLICSLEESHISCYYLDLKDDYLNNNIYQEKSSSGNLKQSVRPDFNQTFKGDPRAKPNKTFLKRSTATFGLKNNNTSLIDFLPKEATFDCSQKYLTEQYFKEKNEDVKQLLFKHLKKIRAMKNPLLFDSSQIKEYLRKRNDKISQDCAIDYKNGYDMITKFIEDLLKELENDTIIPYSVRVICLFINELVRKKFKTISRLDLNSFICRFLFDKLIFPVLINPERCDIGRDRLITLATRKNLFNIYLILKNLVKGELFSTEKEANLIIFNKFILDNYHKINTIIEKMIDIKMPEKLKKLCKQFYATNDFVLDNSKRTEEEINYEYFKENPTDFMQHKSICFTINELNMFYDIVDENKEVFLTPGSKFEDTFETLSNFISMIKGKPDHYFVIISDNYNKEAQELLFHKDTTKPLGKGKTPEEIIENLHYCISYLIGNLDILPHWDWVVENYKTLETFQFINQYLNSYEGIYNFYPGSVPLNWYSLYIINNLNYIRPEDAINDYQPLYNEIESKISQQHKKLSKLNEFLTVNMTTKFLLIDNKIKIFEEELKNVKNTFVNIKTLQLLDSKEITVYLTSVEELKRSGVQLEAMDDVTGYNNLIMQKESIKLDKNTNKKKYEIPKDYICVNINHFITQLMRYYKYIFEELKVIPLYDSKSKSAKKQINPESIATNPETKAKNILDSYLNYVHSIFEQSNLFKDNTTVSNEDNNFINFDIQDNVITVEEENAITSEETAKKSILNYILKILCVKMLSTKVLFNEDVEFYKKCVQLKNITIKDLKIPEEIYDKSIFDKIISHIKNMDEVRTPEEMLKEFELAVQLINSLFIFMMDKKETGNDNLTPVIIYVIIKAKPKRMYFNIKFINYFFDEKNKKGKNEYYIIQAITSLDYIMKELKIDSIEKNKNKNNKKKEKKEGDDAAPTPLG